MTSLDPLLKPLNQQLEIFLALLEEESIALASNNSERLDELTYQRHSSSQQLAENWRQLTEELGFSADASLPALCMRVYADSHPSAAWQLLEKLTHEASRLNRVNGRLIEEQMHRTQAALHILQSASTRSLYGADGRLNDILNSNRSIDSA